MASTFNARNAAVYERSMGRWSSRLAPALLEFAGLSEIGHAEAVLDVGCGTGSLLQELVKQAGPRRIAGIDASAIYAEAARERMRDPRVDILTGDACALPYRDASFNLVLSQLVLQFVSDPGTALAEMRRVLRPAGIVVAAVWNSRGGMPHQRMFWDSAALIDPRAGELRARTFNRMTTRDGELAALFATAGLQRITTSTATIAMTFSRFDDFWGPIADGEGTLGRYVLDLQPETASLVRSAVEDAYLSGDDDGPRTFHCTAYLCRGLSP
jgi:ubiquinone/menaquinone biosynthesis C-methylase UbiE